MTGSAGLISEEQQVDRTWSGVKKDINQNELECFELQQQQQQLIEQENDVTYHQIEESRAPEGTRIGLALIGLGRMGQIHLRNSLKEIEAKLLYCFDTDTRGLEECSSTLFFDELGIKTLHCSEFQIALDDPDVEAVVIATPTDYHEHYIRRALEAGKNVLCEKPLCSNTDSIIPLYDLATKNDVTLTCAFNRRYDPDFRNIRMRSLNRERVGDIQMIKITSRDPSLPPLKYLKNSGGLLHDSVVHDIDISIWLMRQLPIRVQAVGKTFEQYFRQNQEAYLELSLTDRAIADQLDDFFLAIVTLTFPDGSIVIIDNSRQSSYGYDQRIEVFCSKSMLRLDGKTALDVIEYGSEGKSSSPIYDSFANRYQTAYANELRDLIKLTKLTRLGLQTNRQAQIEELLEPHMPMSVYATHKIADAAMESWQSNSQPIELRWTPEVGSRFHSELI